MESVCSTGMVVNLNGTFSVKKFYHLLLVVYFVFLE
jgi:hypothetical protein